MRALISGQAGIAVLIEGEEYTSIKVPSFKPVRRTSQDVAYLLGDARDLFELEGVSRAEAARELEMAWRKDRGLQLALVVLDGQEDRDDRASAAQCMTNLLQYSSVTDFLKNRFYAAPLPKVADLSSALELAESSGATNFAGLLRAVGADQESIRRVRLAWDAIRPDLFGGPIEKERFGFAAVESGAFRFLAADPDEALSRFREFAKRQYGDAKWNVPALFNRWRQLVKLASRKAASPEPLEIGAALSRRAAAEVRRKRLAAIRISAVAATIVLVVSSLIIFDSAAVSARDSVALTPGGTAGVKATSLLLRKELGFKWGRTDAIRYFEQAEKALANGQFSEAVRFYEMSGEAVDTPAAQLNFGIALYNTLQLPKAASILSAGLQKARTKNDDLLVSAFLINLGNVYREQGLLDEATQQYSEAWEIDSRKVGPPPRVPDASGYKLALATVAFNRGLLLGMRGAVSAAYSQFDIALRIYRQTRDRAGEADAAVAQSSYVAIRAGIFDDRKLALTAVENLKTAAALYQSLPGPLAEANYHYAVGKGYFLQAYDYLADESLMDRAAEAYQKARAIYESIGYKQGQVLATYELASTYSFRHDSVRADDSWRRFLTIAEEIDSPFREALGLNGIGSQDRASGDYLAASERFERAARLASRIGAYGLAATALYQLGTLHGATGDTKSASTYFERATEAAKRSGDSDLLISTAMDVANSYIQMHDVERSREALSRLRDLYSGAGYVDRAAAVQRKIDQLPHKSASSGSERLPHNFEGEQAQAIARASPAPEFRVRPIEIAAGAPDFAQEGGTDFADLHGGDPSSVEFCYQVGMNYVSCSPYRVPIARLAAAQAAIAGGDKSEAMRTA